jgi:lipid A 4'-phosphatase
LIVLAVLGVALAALFVGYPALDLMTARALVGENGAFVMSGHPVARVANEGIEILLQVTGAVLVLVLALVWWRRRPFLGFTRRSIVFVFLSFVIGPGVITNVIFKDHWGRARPSQIVEFGGERSFSPAFAISDQCRKNCSFFSGDASAAFGYLSFALLAKRRRAAAVGAALVFGGVIGAIRMMQGAHFLSDVAFAGIFTSMIVVALDWALLSPAGITLPASIAGRMPWLQRWLGPSPGW